MLSQTRTNDQIAELRKLLMLYIEKNDKRVNEIIIALHNLTLLLPDDRYSSKLLIPTTGPTLLVCINRLNLMVSLL